MLVPENVEKVVMQTGMSREQKFLLHFHDAAETLTEIDNRSLIYQMPDRPYLSPDVHRDSGVWPDVFADKWDMEVEKCLTGRADGHCHAYGMLNFGDSYDSGYTAQGAAAEIWSGATMSMTFPTPVPFCMSARVSEGFWIIILRPAVIGWMWTYVIITRMRVISADSGNIRADIVLAASWSAPMSG